MNETQELDIHTLYEAYKQLAYAQKLEFFHRHFSIIPFPFPETGIAISWFYNEADVTTLIGNLNSEIRDKYIYKRSFSENGNMLVFDIKPVSQNQRIQYNTFLLSLFLSKPYNLLSDAVQTLTSKDGSLSSLDAKYKQVYAMLEEMKIYLQRRNAKVGLRLQFIRVFYAGFFSYNSGKTMNLRVRHKFVELYLYSQGIIIAGYLHHLQKAIRKHVADKRKRLS
jgi:hypothetical protein